jgi:alpha-2-macroglobulin-like protein
MRLASLRTWSPLFIFSLLQLTAACSSGSGVREEEALDGGAPPVGTGETDGAPAPTTTVGVPEPIPEEPIDVIIEPDDDEVVISVPDLEAGTYEASIISLSDSQVISSAQWESDPSSTEADAVVARLELPADLDTQADQVRYNVKIVRKGEVDEIVLLRSLLYFLEPYEVQLEGPAKVTQGKDVAYRVIARDPVTKQGLPDRKVGLDVTVDEEEVESLEATTDELGAATLKVALKKPGAHKVAARATGTHSAAKVAATVQSEPSSNKVLLTTDKPLYKPGQTIHLRALALQRAGNRPAAGEQAVFEVEDGKGNKILKRTLTTDEFGIASAPFKIGGVVNEGTFKIRALVGESVSEKTVTVGQYALPKFKLGVKTEQPWYLAGDRISGVIDVHYFFGKAVQGGSIKIEAATLDVERSVYETVMGETNENGVFEFSVGTPSTLVGLPLEQGLAAIDLTVTATDAAGQVVTVDSLVKVAQSPMLVSVVPEGTELILGMENDLSVFVTDPVGAPVGAADLVLSAQDGEELSATTNKLGYTTLRWTPTSSNVGLTGSVTKGDVQVTGLSFSFGAQAGEEHILVRTDKSVYDVGESVEVEILTSDDEGSVFVDWLNDGQAVDLRALEPSAGTATFTMDLDDAKLGQNRVEAYIVQADGNLVRAGRTIFVRNASALNVDIETDQDIYAPGAPAQITFNVTDESGAPAAAALGVQIVDEAVFALIDARPGLLNTYFELEDEFATPTYELHAPPGSIADLIFQRPVEEEEQNAAQSKAKATFAALGRRLLMGISAHSWPDVVTAGNALLAPVYAQEKGRLVEAVNALMGPAIDTVEADGCSIDSYWCDAQEQTFAALVAGEVVARLSSYDLWGNAYGVQAGGYPFLTVSTRGPDEVPGTADDHRFDIELGDLDLARAIQGGSPGGADAGVFAPPGAFDPNLPVAEGDVGGGGDDEAAPDLGPLDPTTGAGGASNSGDDGEGSPRVRREFPETLYFNPSVITDSSGTATIELELADSITEWRISSMANSAQGRLGSAVGGMTVFQDFFVDVNFPATLTRGDEVSFPIAIYNYLEEVQTVNLELQAETWYTALGETALSIELQPGEIRGVSFPVRVEEVGLKTLTVQGIGSEKSDAVARTVRVVPDGKALVTAQSGSVGASVNHDVQFAADAITGSEQFNLSVFPTFLSQAVSGLDSMLQTPSGCFEQTTSNAWPNVLVTRYMLETDQITPDVQLKAEALMSAGYQRLLTFEHPGGGYSWFGTADPAPFLSVTAFGLMEFHDMAKVHEVDPAMLERTLAYLLANQQADGSWQGDNSEFFSFITSTLRNSAFTLMAVGSSGYTGPEVGSAVDYILSELQSEQTLDAYTLALVANALASVAPNEAALTGLLERLVEVAQVDASDDTKVSWDTGDTQTNFYGYGNDADVTTTAMAVHALLLAGGYGDVVTKGLNTLVASKDALGNFGSTQATVWALKALLLAATKGTASAIGTLDVLVDGEPIRSIELTEDQADVMTTVDLRNLATAGTHNVELVFSGEGKPSYAVVSGYNVPWAEAPEEAPGPLSVDISYDRTQLVVDETVTASVVVANNTASTQNMALVTVGLPPGFEVERDDFAQYLAAGTLSKVEVTGKQVILYVSEIGANAEVTYSYRLRATMPIKASDGGGSVYPYYQPDQKREAAEQQIEVLPPS